MALVRSGDFTFAFPTLVLKRKPGVPDEVNAELRAFILALRNEQQSLNKSNIGAWHSSLDFLTLASPGLERLRGLLLSNIKEYWVMDQQRDATSPELAVRLVGWAMVYGAGHYSVPHNHPNANFSGVYYVDAGDSPASEPMSGVLTLLDPRSAGGLETGGWSHASTFDIRPETGQLVLFPAWLTHYVHPYRGERERIAISMNVSVHRVADTAAK